MASRTLQRVNWAAELLSSSRNTQFVPRRPISRSHLSTASAKPPARSIASSTNYRQSQSSSSASTASKPPPPPVPKPSTPPSTTPAKPTPTATTTTVQNISRTGLADKPPSPSPSDLTEQTPNTQDHVDWTRSFHGLSAEPFSKEAAEILLQEIPPEDVEIKPDGIVYLPEIKYRRILNKAFGPGGWGLAPRGESIVTAKTVTREYALVAHGRLVSIARGEQDYFSPDGIPTATEGCKSNAMMRCCKDLGVASQLWDPRWIRQFRAKYTREAFVEHVTTKRRTKIWVRKDDAVSYPWKETK
ncbi:hypothetical protein FQN55_000881 [Onygenales sp. PD_40]|nr:hypothetical protein FQN55_000881 [Onygenales sp. PD_40]